MWPKFFRATWPPLFLMSGSVAWAAFFFVSEVYFMTALLGVIALIFLADFAGRSEDFMSRFYENIYGDNPVSEKVAKLYGRTWCGRTVILATFNHVSLQDFPHVMTVKKFYRNRLGYRWYHILPDGTFSRNSPFFRLKFWRNLWRGHA